MPREHDDSGDFIETVTPENVLDVFDQIRGPVVTSGDVAEACDCTRETARRKLKVLHEQGRVDRRKTAGRIVWWCTDDVIDPASTLKQLSQQLAEPIVVGDTVYEDGDQHPLSDAQTATEGNAGEEMSVDE